jgi:phosphoribosylamine--glycine ligase
MKILLLGSGGREHALAWKIVQSPRFTELYTAPGNAGTELLGRGAPFPIKNVALDLADHNAVIEFAKSKRVDLVIIGPEASLAAGLADDLREARLKVFGPSKAAAQIESSKAFAKAFMARHNLPTAAFHTFTNAEAALAHLRATLYPNGVVVKASGLAAGKGVIVAEAVATAEAAVQQMMVDRAFGAAGDEIVIEARLTGPEVSLLAFTDGKAVKPMPPAQDHKRLLAGDLGPNTGGMGAFAPTPLCSPELVAELTKTILQPTVDGLREEGMPFVGVLYAGLMLTPDGPRILEFNCRFGDPETQALLPLLGSDLLEVMEACVNGKLGALTVQWRELAAACVVLASEGYPGASPLGRPILNLDAPRERATIFHAGTKLDGDQAVTAGGRVLNIVGFGETLAEALGHAYDLAGKVTFEGAQWREDIGKRT